MINNPVVFVTDDHSMKERFDTISEELTKRGIRVIRGPKTKPGEKLRYQDEDLQKYFQDAHVLMFSPRSICDERVIKAARNAIGVVHPGIGVETIDIKAASEHGIIVAHAPIPENFISVAEVAISYMLMLSHRVLQSVGNTYGKCEITKGKCTTSTSLFGKKIGFIGFGRIGRAVAERMQFFGVEMLAYSPTLTQDKVPDYVKVCPLEEVIRESDFLGLYVVINDKTYNMINKETLSMMKPTAYLINIARGEAVNEDDLYEALKNKTIAGAALDVFHVEPLPAESKLRELDNVILTPHMAANTIENYQGGIRTAVENITRMLNGELPLYYKNPEIAEAWKERWHNN